MLDLHLATVKEKHKQCASNSKINTQVHKMKMKPQYFDNIQIAKYRMFDFMNIQEIDCRCLYNIDEKRQTSRSAQIIIRRRQRSQINESWSTLA